MIHLAPSAVDALAESARELTSGVSKNVPIIGNAAICADSVFTAGINFYCSPNPVAKVFFGASCLCGVIGAGSSGTALITSFAGIPAGVNIHGIWEILLMVTLQMLLILVN